MRLSAYDFKLAVAGAISTAPVLQLVKDGINLKLKKEEIEFIQSDKVAPSKVYDLGFSGEIKAVIVSDDLEYLAIALRSDYENEHDEILTLNQELKEAELFDIEFKVSKLYSIELFLIKNLTIEAKLDASFKVGNAFYLPITFLVSATSQMTVISI